MDQTMSRWIADAIRAQQGRCWRNAVTALRETVTYPQLAGAVYVEGWATRETQGLKPMAFEHGWLALPDGTIVDPTLITVIRPDDTVTYYPAIRYTLEDLDPYTLDQLPLVWQHGWGGMRHPEYAQACVDAWLACGVDMRSMIPGYQTE